MGVERERSLLGALQEELAAAKAEAEALRDRCRAQEAAPETLGVLLAAVAAQAHAVAGGRPVACDGDIAAAAPTTSDAEVEEGDADEKGMNPKPHRPSVGGQGPSLG